MARLIDAKDFDLRVSQKKMSEVFPNWKELPKEVQDAVCKHGQYIHMLLETQPTVDAAPHWIPVTQEMPKEHKSVIPGYGTVSKPVLIAFVDITSNEPYPKNCVVCEGISHNGEFKHKSYSGDYKAIAWMERPAPPKEV